jgi:hypothetical protein
MSTHSLCRPKTGSGNLLRSIVSFILLSQFQKSRFSEVLKRASLLFLFKFSNFRISSLGCGQSPISVKLFDKFHAVAYITSIVLFMILSPYLWR